MSESGAEQEMEQLRARITALEQLKDASEKAAAAQAGRLELSLEELRERALQLEQSEDALRRQTRILQAILRSMGSGVIVAHETGKFLLFNPAAEQILGIGAADLTPAEWSQHYGCYLPDQITPYPPDRLPLSRAIQGEDVQDTTVFIRNDRRPQGIWLSVTARPVRDEYGVVRGGLSVFHDISKQKLGEQRLAAQHAVTRVLAEAATLDEATPKILEAICAAAGWELGAIWQVDRKANVLRCVDVWQRLDSQGKEFAAVTRACVFGPGQGLPGHVWANREQIWVGDFAARDDMPRRAVAARDGFHGAFAFPILFAREVTGVIEFLGSQVNKPDDDLLSMISSLGSQIGQFIERKHAEEELRKSRARFELAMRGSGDGLWDWDVESNQVYYSPSWKSALGYEDHEIQHSFDEWEKRLHPEDRARAMETIQAYFEGRAPTYRLEHRLRHKDGSYRWIVARGVALRDAHGKPYRMAGSHTDITEQRQAEEAVRNSEALYHSLVETLPLNVFRKDLQGRFTFANQRFCRTVGKTVEELLGKTDFDLFPAHLAEKYRQDDRKVTEDGEVLDVVEEHRKPDGQKIYVHVLKTQVHDAHGHVVGTQGIFWDETDRVLAQEAMQKGKEAAESANRAKSVFLANMSHEIRTPMNAIIGMTDLVLETGLSIEQREYLELVQKSAHSLLAVINDILDFSKVEAGRLELDSVTFSLRDHLGDTLNTLAPRAYQKGLELACHVPANVPDMLQGDPVRLGQIIVNLVGNALKFTEQGEVVVDVALDSRTEGDARLHFTVTDTGIGVPPDKLEFIFDPFAQADGSTTRRFGGTGLGLAIARRLVEAMDGRIWVESQLGKGSTFHFTTRFALAGGAAFAPVLPQPETMYGMQVLVVDDNATNRRILEETLNQWQLRPTLVPSGPAALDAMLSAARAGEPFPLALIDVHMPDMDGYALVEQIRRYPELQVVTLIMLTSGGQPGDSARRRQLGIAACLTKPVKQADLWKAIMQALGMPLPQDDVADTLPVGRTEGKRPLRILLAEDNLINQKLAVRLLEKRGHKVLVANNGREALAQLETRCFDVVLMDVQMPEMDGLEATAVIRAQEKETGQRVPIIAMTAYAMKGDRERCLAAGMDHYICKPIRAQELFAAVEGVHGAPVNTRQATRENGAEPGVLDEEAALDRAGGDRELLQDLVELYLREAPRLLQDVQKAVARGDPAQVKIAAHSLKGAVDNFAAKDAFAAASRLEILGRNGNLAGAEEAFAILEREMDRLKLALSQLLAARVSP
jgi:two-component system, sensor histidine kinase and response regulator